MRLLRLLPEVIAQMRLDLGGLRVLTEAASGPYLANPVLAAAAGGEVVAVAADTRFHRAADVERDVAALAARCGVAVRVVREAAPHLGWADVVTNTGPLRPIDAALVAALRPTAVVALGWETWEHLPEQVDLDACRARGILVLGTNEHEPPCDLRPYAGPLAIKVLLELGLEVTGTRVALLGCQPTLGAPMAALLRAAGARVTAFGTGARPPAELEAWLAREPCDVVLVADHGHAPLDPAAVPAHVPVAVVTGDVDGDALRARGVAVHPGRLGPPGRMTRSIAELGPRPVLELFAASLRVAEVAARARLAGCDVREAARRALRDAPAMDFEGERAWS